MQLDLFHTLARILSLFLSLTAKEPRGHGHLDNKPLLNHINLASYKLIRSYFLVQLISLRMMCNIKYFVFEYQIQTLQFLPSYYHNLFTEISQYLDLPFFSELITLQRIRFALSTSIKCRLTHHNAVHIKRRRTVSARIFHHQFDKKIVNVDKGRLFRILLDILQFQHILKT